MAILLLIISFSCQRIETEIVDKDDVVRAQDKLGNPKSWLDTLCSKTFSGRKTGTLGNKKAAVFLYNEAEKMGYTPMIQSFVHSSGDTLRNILVEKKGIKDSVIIIGAHYDGQNESKVNVHYEAANDNASGVVTLLSVMDSLTRTDTNYSIRAIFFDGEEGCIPPAFKGSSYYVETLNDKSRIVLYINMDAMGHDHNNQMILGWYGNQRVNNMVNQLYHEKAFSYVLKARASGEGSSDYRSFSAKNIPYISYTDISLNCENPQHSILDTKDQVDLNRLKHIGNLTIGIINSF